MIASSLRPFHNRQDDFGNWKRDDGDVEERGDQIPSPVSVYVSTMETVVVIEACPQTVETCGKQVRPLTVENTPVPFPPSLRPFLRYLLSEVSPKVV